MLTTSCLPMDANNDCRRNVTGLECIHKECMQPNAWFHWAHAVDDASKWAAASTYINYDIVMPETSKQAIQLFRRTNVVEFGKLSAFFIFILPKTTF